MSLRTQRNSMPLLQFEWKRQYTAEGWWTLYEDNFDDAALGSEWTTHGLGPDRTISLAAGVCTIEIKNGVDARWWCTFPNRAPKMYMRIPGFETCGQVTRYTTDLRITTKLLSYTVNDDTFAGIFIGTNPEGEGNITTRYAWKWGRERDDSAAWPFKYRMHRNCGSEESDDGGAPYLPVWFRINVDSSGDITFWWAKDGVTWEQFESPGGTPFSVAGYDIANSYIGLFATNIMAPPPPAGNIAAPFEFFKVEVNSEQLTSDCVAPIDVRTPISFYDGRLKSMSTLKRAIDDRTGLFQISDLSVILKNHDKKYSKMLASHQMKNREAILYHAWTEEPEASKSHMITLIVDDYELRGTEFHVKLKDITQKYFTKKVPENICTEADFPDIHPDHVGRYMPEILGNASLSAAYEHPGAIEAVYVDTTGPPFRCLASAGTITIPTDEVWIADVQKTEGVDYSVVYSGGRTFIHFVAGQNPGDDTVAFNAHGYSLAAWDSANGYIQNLAYIMLYFLQYLMGVPISLLNTASFDTLAAYYVTLGVDEECYLIIQDDEDAMEILRELLFTGGAKGFLAKDGKFKVERKDVGNWQIASSDCHIFDQIELLSPSKRQWNLVNAINTVKVEFGYIPWQNMFTGLREDYEENFNDGTQEDHIRRERPDRDRRKRI